MYLTPSEELILNGEYGYTMQKAMEILVALGDIYNADRLIPIRSAQIAGVSYKTIGDAGLEWLSDLNGTVSVPSMLNPAGIDRARWREFGISEKFAVKQEQIISAYEKLGIQTWCTCTPYDIQGDLARSGDHLAWSESSAVSYANSVIGARTNREGGPSALAAAICGRTPDYGLHRFENRQPNVKVKVEAKLSRISDYGALGYVIGKEIKNKIPYFVGIKNASVDQLKSLGAAMAASGAVALYHIEGITPEADLVEKDGIEEISIEERDIKKVYEDLDCGEDPDIVIFGCPHASIREIMDLANLLSNRKLKKPLWICTSRSVKELSDRIGLTEIIERAGGHVVSDTCMVVSPIEKMGYSTTGVNSGKAANYLPGFCKQKVVFASMEELVERIT